MSKSARALLHQCMQSHEKLPQATLCAQLQLQPRFHLTAWPSNPAPTLNLTKAFLPWALCWQCSCCFQRG
jgi:hypothetical protein